jgi:hypothetical protein
MDITRYHEDRANFHPTYWTPRHNITQVILMGQGHHAAAGIKSRDVQVDRRLC